GVISGTPSGSTTASFSVQAADSLGSADTQSLTLTVASAGSSPAPSSSSSSSSGYTPTCGISDMNAKLVPSNYTTAFGYVTTPGSSPIIGPPPAGANGSPAPIWYEPDFANAPGKRFGCPQQLVIGAPNTSPTSSNPVNLQLPYSTINAVSEDDAYIVLRNAEGFIFFYKFDGSGRVCPNLGQSGGLPFWLSGAEKHKLIVLVPGIVVKKYDIDACTETTWDSTSLAGVQYNNSWTNGGGEADITPDGRYLVILTADPCCGDLTNKIWIYDAVSKTVLPQKPNGPAVTNAIGNTFDWCQISHDETRLICRWGGPDRSAYLFDFATGKQLSRFTYDIGHSGFGLNVNNEDVVVTNETRTNWGALYRWTRKWTDDSNIVDLWFKDPDDTLYNGGVAGIDSHYSAHYKWPNPSHHAVVFDFNDTAPIIQGVKSYTLQTPPPSNYATYWGKPWNEIIWCDLASPNSCRRMTHHRWLADGRDCAACEHITRSGKYIYWSGYYGTSQSNRYIVRMGPLY
ncbi:MAG TPA: hypothetical protein VFA89_24830, partial [Terriglobales bacterium]|nr:hypothetical protein [Terriglobales bacterium]